MTLTLTYSIFRTTLTVAAIALLAVLSGCGGGSGPNATTEATRARGAETVAVNRYLWYASLEILDFLPIESADPFTGVIVTGFGTPPGGSTAYRATIYVKDPALDARSLNVSLSTRNGPASFETSKAIEDAILSRARQLRMQDRGL
jgi:hypothetical protein